MFKAIKENKIIAVNETSIFPLLNFDNVKEDREHSVDDYVYVNGQFVLKTDDAAKEQKAAEVREDRDEAINAIIWRVQRYEQQKLLGIETTDSEQTYINILEYIQYLRDIPNTSSFPDSDILNFEEWSANGE